MTACSCVLAAAVTVLGQTSDLTPLGGISEGLGSPTRLAAAPGGGLYVTDQPNGQVLEYDNAGALVTTYAIPELPVGIAVLPSGNVIVSRRDGAVGVYDSSFSLVGTLDPAPASFVSPNDITVHPVTGEVYLVDSDAHQVMVFDISSNGVFDINSNALVRMWGMQGSGLGQFQSPQAIAIDAMHDRVIVADVDNFRVQVFDTAGVLQFKFGYRTLYAGVGEVAWFARSEGLALDSCGNIYIADALMGTVRVFSESGSELDPMFVPAIGYGAGAGELRTPCDVMIDGSDTLYVANTTNANVETFAVSCAAGARTAVMPRVPVRTSTAAVVRRRSASNHLNYPDNPLDIVMAMRNGEFKNRLDINTDWVVDEEDLEMAVARFGGATADDFLNMEANARASYPYPLQPPHMIADLPNLCGRCHSMDGLPGGMLTVEGQANLCVSCHTPGGRAMGMPIAGADDDNSHPWGVPAVPGPDPESELALHLDGGDVRCATCHNPHETLYAEATYLRGSILDGGLCAECHTEVAEWQNAGHADETADPWSHYDWALPSRESCRQCHSGNGFIDYSNGLPPAEQNGAFRVLDCVVCHATHGKPQDETLLRVFGEVTLPTEGPDETVTGVGAMATCMACHNGRVAPDDGSLTPHYVLGGVMLEGINGNTYGFKLVNSPHSELATCMDCHMFPTPAEGQPGARKVGGHSFNMKVHDPTDPDFEFEHVAACNTPACHGNTSRAPSLEITEFNREAFGDYDGDGTTEGVQDETQGLMDLVFNAITTNGAVFLGHYPYWDLSGVVDTSGFLGVIEDAIWNWEYVDNSGDLGIHNTSYAVGLLQVTYRALMGVDVPGAFLRYETPAASYPKTVVEIQGVNGGAPVEPGGAYTVDFTIEDELGAPIPIGDLNRLRMYVSGPATNYQVVIPRDSDLANFTQNPDDSYTYTSPTPFPTEYSAPENDSPAYGPGDGELTGQALLDGTYTALIESRRSFGSVRKAGDATFDFVVANNPGSPPALASRQLITQAACNGCHLDLQLHGGGRFSVTGCVVCHTVGGEDLMTAPGTTPGVTILFDDMIHKIHRSHDLPTVTATANSADPYRYVIIGHNESVNDFSDIGFPIIPDGISSCDSCHGGAAEGATIYARITRANCIGCHNDIDFSSTGTILDRSDSDVQDGLLTQTQLSDPAYRVFPGGINHTFSDDTTCVFCHGTGAFADIEVAHRHPTDDAAEGTNPVVEIISVGGMTGGGGAYFQAGDFFEVTFKLKNDVNDPQQILAGSNGILDRMEVIIAGPTTLYQTIMPAQRFWSSGNLTVPPGNWVDNFAVDGTYTFISEDPFPAEYPAQLNSIGEPPADQVFPFEEGWGQQYTAGGTPLDSGTYTVTVYGRRVTPIGGEREPVATGTANVLYGSAGPVVPYGGTVDTASCNACHGVLAFHGNQREGFESCRVCHTAGTQDGGTLESVDLRIMVHKLHNARNLTNLPYEMNGHSGISDFSHLLISSMPGEAAECQVCHVNDAWENPPMRDNMRTWMVACTSCHDASETRTHVNAATLAGTFVETCTACHGQGAAWSVAKVHATP